MATICGIISHSGPNGEPLACAYAPGHEGVHSWATLPTFVAHTHEWHPIGFTPHPSSGGLMPTDGCMCGARRYPYSPEVPPTPGRELARRGEGGGRG